MKFPKKIFPHLYELERMEFSNPRKDSWEYRSEHKEILWREYRDRLDLIEHRVLILGGNNKIHNLDADNNTQ